MSSLTKAEIVEAIRAWVSATGTVPGRRSFENANATPRTAFEGMYWASWSDAVREAGFEPQGRNEALDEDQMLSAYAALIREMGRFPSKSELNYRKKVDPRFPSVGVLVRRVGATTQQRSDRVREWCQAHPEYSDVLTLLPRAHGNQGNS